MVEKTEISSSGGSIRDSGYKGLATNHEVGGSALYYADYLCFEGEYKQNYATLIFAVAAMVKTCSNS